jgi:hypothetical protein
MCRTRQHSPSHVARTRQTQRDSPSRVARTRQTCERRVWQVLHEFSESGKFGECRLDHFMHIKYVICAKNSLSCALAPTFAKRLGQYSTDSPTFAKPCCADSLNSPTFAKPFTEYSPDLPTFAKGQVEKNVTRLAKSARVICDSRKFGASGHCLVLLQ